VVTCIEVTTPTFARGLAFVGSLTNGRSSSHFKGKLFRLLSSFRTLFLPSPIPLSPPFPFPVFFSHPFKIIEIMFSPLTIQLYNVQNNYNSIYKNVQFCQNCMRLCATKTVSRRTTAIFAWILYLVYSHHSMRFADFNDEKIRMCEAVLLCCFIGSVRCSSGETKSGS
jgi:hypothetical protein